MAASSLRSRSLPLLSRMYSTASAAGGPDRIRQALGYCVSQVREYDYENYLWCTQLPKELRAPIITLRAFNVETALIEHHAKSEMLILMRCQWWRDAINSAYKGKAPEQPTMTALAHILESTNLTRYRLQRMISTREEDMLRTEAPPTLHILEESAEGIHSQLLYLQLEAAGISSKEADHAASHVGKAAGLASMLRATHFYAQRHKSYLPRDLCEKYGIVPEDLSRGDPTSGLRDVVFSIASAAMGHLEVARAKTKEVPKEARALLLPALSAGLYLSALEKKNFNVFDPDLIKGGFSPVRYGLELKYKMLRGQF